VSEINNKSQNELWDAEGGKRHEEYVRKTKDEEVMRIYDCKMKNYWIQLVL
jgi:hypothetical protein